MRIFGSRRSAVPRLAPELDDAKLGRVCKKLEAASWLDLADIWVEEVLKEAGTDWDRRTHRFLVLAAVADPGLARLWARRRPRAADALMLRVWMDLQHGRSTGKLEDPQAIIDTCHRAAELQPADPGPWTALLVVRRLLRQPPHKVFPVWREVTSRDAWHREAYLQMLDYLSPEECGSHAQELEFVDAARSSMPTNAPAIGLELRALVGRYRRTLSAGGVNGLMAGLIWKQPPTQAALDRALDTWLQPGFLTHAATLADLNLLAYSLVLAKRYVDAAAVFDAIATNVTPWPWELDGDPIEQFTHWRARTLT